MAKSERVIEYNCPWCNKEISDEVINSIGLSMNLSYTAKCDNCNKVIVFSKKYVYLIKASLASFAVYIGILALFLANFKEMSVRLVAVIALMLAFGVSIYIFSKSRYKLFPTKE